MNVRIQRLRLERKTAWQESVESPVILPIGQMSDQFKKPGQKWKFVSSCFLFVEHNSLIAESISQHSPTRECYLFVKKYNSLEQISPKVNHNWERVRPPLDPFSFPHKM